VATPSTAPAGTAKVWALTGLIAVAAAVLHLLVFAHQESPVQRGSVPLIALIGLFLVVEMTSLHVTLGRDAHTVTFSEVPFVIGLFLTNPSTVITARVIGVAVGYLAHRRVPLKIAFNVAQAWLSTLVGVEVWLLLAGGESHYGARDLLAAFAAAISMEITSSLSVTTVIALRGSAVRASMVITSLSVGARLSKIAPARTCVARLGGDEFAVVLGDADVLEAERFAEDIRLALVTPLDVMGVMLTVDASVGISLAPAHGDDIATLLRSADVAMYAAKSSHAGVVVYAPDSDHYSAARLALVPELRGGIAAGQLVLAYQPKVETASGRVYGVEALVRWQHPVRRAIQPDDFIVSAAR